MFAPLNDAERRRLLLDPLHEDRIRVTGPSDGFRANDPDRLRPTHSHLPKFFACEFVEWTRDAGVVATHVSSTRCRFCNCWTSAGTVTSRRSRSMRMGRVIQRGRARTDCPGAGTTTRGDGWGGTSAVRGVSSVSCIGTVRWVILTRDVADVGICTVTSRPGSVTDVYRPVVCRTATLSRPAPASATGEQLAWDGPNEGERWSTARHPLAAPSRRRVVDWVAIPPSRSTPDLPSSGD